MLKCDLHLHARENEDWIKYSAKELIDKASELGFDVLSFTFHDEFFYPDDIVEYARSKEILLVPGVELTIEGKHVLIYGLKGLGKINCFDDLRRIKKREDIVIVAPHPFFVSKQCLGNKLIENIDLFDGIEYCHFYNHLFNFNKKAVSIAKKYGKCLIGNSDCHVMPLQFNRTFSYVDAEKNIDSVLNAIREGRVSVVSKPLPLVDVFKIAFKMRLVEALK
jgi:hypothetical protein